MRNLGLRAPVPPAHYRDSLDDTSSSGSSGSPSSDSDDSDNGYLSGSGGKGTSSGHLGTSLSRQGTMAPNNTPDHLTPIATPRVETPLTQPFLAGSLRKNRSRSTSPASEHEYRSMGPSPTGPRPSPATEADSEKFDISLQKYGRSTGSIDLLRDAGFRSDKGGGVQLRTNNLSRTSSSSSYSSHASNEVVVEGGLALTEEAIETHIPDLITAV